MKIVERFSLSSVDCSYVVQMLREENSGKAVTVIA